MHPRYCFICFCIDVNCVIFIILFVRLIVNLIVTNIRHRVLIFVKWLFLMYLDLISLRRLSLDDHYKDLIHSCICSDVLKLDVVRILTLQ